MKIKFVCACGEEVTAKKKTAKEKLIEEIALRIAYALPYHYCDTGELEPIGWIAEDEEDLVRAAMSVADQPC
jgi:hypothetical protein